MPSTTPQFHSVTSSTVCTLLPIPKRTTHHTYNLSRPRNAFSRQFSVRLREEHNAADTLFFADGALSLNGTRSRHGRTLRVERHGERAIVEPTYERTNPEKCISNRLLQQRHDGNCWQVVAKIRLRVASARPDTTRFPRDGCRRRRVRVQRGRGLATLDLTAHPGCPAGLSRTPDVTWSPAVVRGRFQLAGKRLHAGTVPVTSSNGIVSPNHPKGIPLTSSSA